MEDSKSKYDTDPLDPDFVRRTEEISGRGATREVARTLDERARRSEETTEAPTRRFEESPSAEYPSVFVPPNYQTPPSAPGAAVAATEIPSIPQGPPSSRTLPGINLPENAAVVLPYVPFYIGAVMAVIELFLLPRSETRARFHAAQGLALHLVVLAAGFLFRFANFLVRMTTGETSTILSLFGFLFWIAAVVFMIISIVRVWQGEEHRLAPLAGVTRWLNEQIEPRK